MKKNYMNPQMTVRGIDTELMIAGSSDTLGRGTGSGGNNAEVKSQRSTEYSNPVNWDE